MFTEARKLSLIEAIIKSSNHSMLEVIEGLVEKQDSMHLQSSVAVDFSDLIGVLTAEEAATIEQTIDEHFEKVNPDDWK